MTLTYLGNQTWYTDTLNERPTGISNRAVTLEIPTRKTFRYDGTKWISPSTAYPGGASVRVYKEGTTYVAELYDGTILSTSNTDASVVINAAIAAIPVAAVAGDVTYKGRVFIHGAAYDCKTLIDVNGLTLGYHGVQLIGEGAATRLNFSPASALPIAIRMRMSRPRISNLRIWGNSNVAKLVGLVNEASNSMFQGTIDYVQFDGANYNTGNYESALAEYQAGQQGLHFDGQFHSSYFWNINNCAFRGLEYGINLADVKATSTAQSGNYFLNCRVGEKVVGSQNNISNVWIQGSALSGDIGIWCVPAGALGAKGSLTNISNVQIELYGTADVGSGLGITDLPRAGAIGILKDQGTANIRTSNITSTKSDGGDVVDLVPYNNFDTESRGVIRVSKSIANLTGSLMPGAVPITQGDGILAGNIVESAGGSNFSLTGGAARRYNTTTTISTPRYMYYNQGGTAGNDSMWGRAHNPTVAVRFLLAGTNPTTGVRLFIGHRVGGTSFGNPVAASDVLASATGIGVGLDTSLSANFRVQHNNGAANSSYTNFDTPVTATQATTLAAAVTVETDNAANMYVCSINGRCKRVTANIPTSGHHSWLIFFQNTATEDKWLYIYEVEMLAKGA